MKAKMHAGDPCVVCGCSRDAEYEYFAVDDRKQWEEWITLTTMDGDSFTDEYEHCVPVAGKIWRDPDADAEDMARFLLVQGCTR